MLTSGFDNSQLRLMSCPAADVLSSSCFVTSVGFSEEVGEERKKKRKKTTLNKNHDHYMVGGFAIQIFSTFSLSLMTGSYHVREGRGKAVLLFSTY